MDTFEYIDQSIKSSSTTYQAKPQPQAVQRPVAQTRTVQRQLPPPDSGRHLSRQELATMSNLEKRLQGKRTGPQSLLDKHELEKQSQLAYAYKVREALCDL